MSIGKTLLFRNPSTGDSIKLPPNHELLARACSVMSFSAPPTSPDCVVFGLVNISKYDDCEWMTFIRRGDRSWHEICSMNRARLYWEGDRLVARHQISSSRKRVMVHRGNRCKFRPFPCHAEFEWSEHQSAPVFHNGAFYCLSQGGGGGRGRLGIFDPTKKSKNKMWRILDVGSCRNFFPTSHKNQSYMMESSRGELISVYVGQYGEYVTVFKLDEDLRLWQIVCNLRDQVALLSPTSSMVLPCRELQVKGLENTIQFARFDDGYNVFYSLSTRKFHSFKNGYTSGDLFDTELYLNSTWIVPDFQSYSRQRLNWVNLSSDDNTTIVVNNSSHYVCNSIFSSQLSNRIVKEQVAEPVGGPFIILSHEEGKLQVCPFFDLVNGRDRMESCLRGKLQVYGGSNGRAVLMDFESRDFSLLNTSTMAMEPLPTWPMPDAFHYYCCVVREWNSMSTVTIMGILGENSEQFVSMKLKCRVGDKEWTTHEGGHLMDEAVGYQGTIYGFGRIYLGDDRFGIGMLKMEDLRVEVVEMVTYPTHRLVGPSIKREYLVESCGEILLFWVFKSTRNQMHYNNIIMEVRAYKLVLKENIKWEEVKDLGDRVFFLCDKTKGFGCSASSSGFPRNNLYFVWDNGENVVRYNYGDQSIRTVVTLEEGCKILGFVM
ncbi:hypothetical protein LINGRAHAP2_LOCUS21956 [Linum grandiflorum]